MKKSSFTAILLVVLPGCTGMMTTTEIGPIKASYTGIKCNRAIEYQSNTIKLTGLEVPIKVTAGNDLKIGDLEIKEENIRDASDLIKLIDELQFSTCQDMLLVKNEDNRMILAKRKNDLIQLFSTLLNGLQHAQNEAGYTSATADAKATLANIQKK